MEVPYVMSEGHHLAEIGGHLFVIDTGSPISFSFDASLPSLSVCSQAHSLPVNPMGLDKGQLDGMIGAAVSGIIGLDVLERSGGIRFDRSAPTITFGPCGSAPESFQVPLRMLNLLGLRAVLISAKINGQNSDKVLLDTGARVGYLSESLLGDAASDGEAVDFAPSFGGRIDTDKYVAEIALGGKPFVIPMAKMTPMMEWGAAMLGSSAFLGINGIFEEALCIDFQAGRVSMR